MAENLYKVRLVSAVTGLSVPFDVTPDLIENRNVNYKTLDPIHMPGNIYVYGNTSSRTFNISNAKFISRTPKEASATMKYLNRLRGWTTPYFGKSSTLTFDQAERRRAGFTAEQETFDAPDTLEILGRELLGAPPDVLYLSAYSDYTTSRRRVATNINRIPVVMQQLSIPYPSDTDYIQDENNQPIPTLLSVDLTLAETHSPREYNNFSIQDYRNGKLPNF